jgi:GcrA cell cycle regulator
MGKNTWSPDEIELLTTEWNAGSSGSQCADVLNQKFKRGLSRNAVIGKAHRLGLSEHPTTIKARIVGARRIKNKTAVQLKQTSQLAHEPLSDPIPTEVIYYKTVAFFDLAPHHCRYPVSGDHGLDFQFCGNHQHQGYSYCSGHVLLTHNLGAWRRR